MKTTNRFARFSHFLTFSLSHFPVFPLSRFPVALATLLAALLALPVDAADPIIETFQKALFEEEANQNYEVAIRAYTEVVGKLDDQRKLAATALFRLAECYRKLGRTNDALTAYQRVMREFPDQAKLVELSRPYVVEKISGPARTLPAEDRAKLKDLLQQELRIAEQFLAEQQQQAKVGRIATGEETRFERDVLGLKRQLLAVDGFSDPEVRSQGRALLLEEIKLAEKAAQVEKAKLDAGRSIPAEFARLQRDVLTLKRELITFDATPASQPFELQTAFSSRLQEVVERASGSSVSDEEEKEIRRMRALIQDSPDLINARNNAGLAPLHSAAGAGYARVVRFLLESGADPNLKAGGPNNGVTALHSAARNGHKSVIDLLLDAKADAAARDGGSNTPLHLAALHGYRLIVERLLAAGVPVNGRNVVGMTPLHNAVAAGHQSVVELLFKKGADLNLSATSRSQTASGPEVLDGYTPVHTAIAGDQITMVRWLNTNGANVNAPAGRDRITPLHLAARNNNVDAIRALIRGGLDLEAADASGQTPLHIAVSSGKVSAAELLLEAGANPNGRSGAASPLLHTVGESEELLRLLLKYKADLDVTNRSGRTLMLYLSESVYNSTNLINLLLDAGANPNAGLANGFVPLHAAAVRASPEITTLLLRHGAEVNAMTSEGATPLYYARNANNSWRTGEHIEQTVALLLASGADETLQRRRSISVSRRTRGFETSIFAKGTNDLNRYSLFELITTVYQRNGAGGGLPFPDLEHLVVNRALGGGRTADTNLDVEARLASSDCAGDFWLEWGDVVEIPELDHPLPANWGGFKEDFARTVAGCVSRKINIVIKGRTNLYELGSKAINNVFSLPSFRLQEVLGTSGLLLTSSDRTRVRVSRLDPITNEPSQWTLDTTRLSGPNDLWLRNGDVIEVPDLPPGARVTPDQSTLPRAIPPRTVIRGQAAPLPAPPQ